MPALRWRVARLLDTRTETRTARTLVLNVDDWPGHLPGQHVDLRLTAEDGYSAQRSYSISSAPDGAVVELTVQMLPDGEVSPFLVRDYVVGDPIELRGPIGGWFVWDPSDPQPALLIGGGSGVVPLMAMIRTHRKQDAAAPLRLLYSSRTPDDLLYAGELKPSDNVDVTLLYSRSTPPDWPRPPGRLSRDDFPTPDHAGTRVYVCGPTGFVEAVSRHLVDLGYDDQEIRTERFGPSGA